VNKDEATVSNGSELTVQGQSKIVLEEYALNRKVTDPAHPTSDRVALGNSIAQVLGTNPNNENPGEHIAGNMTFVGGFPSTLPVLDLDIVTPHPEDGKGRITPHPFLAIAAGGVWHFPLIALSRPKASESIPALDQAGSWLEKVLTEFGRGARTAAGFGGFRILTEQEKASGQSRSHTQNKERNDFEAMHQY